MIPDTLTPEERMLLLKLARQALETAVRGELLMPLDLDPLPQHLKEPGASFVTLTNLGELRGCIGALEPSQPLAEDVREHAVAAALQYYRFPHVVPEELPDIQIEISRLTSPQPLEYNDPEDLPKILCPNVDGVVLMDGFRRATFLPQVWEKIPDPEEFLANLCYKMHASPDLWRRKKLQVYTYQVEEFHEQAVVP
jgi:AmmeMemoRadiSam system protein A